jgi:hypothetical protein
MYKWKADALAAPVPKEYKDSHMKEFGYDPGQSYFKNLLQNAGLNYTGTSTYDPITNTYKEVVINDKYSNPMLLTVESLNIQFNKVATKHTKSR